jgi:hypothetical protein
VCFGNYTTNYNDTGQIYVFIVCFGKGPKITVSSGQFFPNEKIVREGFFFRGYAKGVPDLYRRQEKFFLQEPELRRERRSW